MGSLVRPLVPAHVGASVAMFTAPPITRYTLALYCGASNDHNPMHVDLDFARKAGMPDVFAHGMLVMAYLGRVVTALAGPRELRSYSVRFLAITHLGDELTLDAHLAELTAEGDERRARLELSARDQVGELKLTGEAVIALPAEATDTGGET